MNWIILIVAGFCEVGFTYCLGRAKDAIGLEWWAWIGGFIIFTVVSMGLLAKATRALPLGTAYPVWTGIGAVGTVFYCHADCLDNRTEIALVTCNNKSTPIWK